MDIKLRNLILMNKYKLNNYIRKGYSIYLSLPIYILIKILYILRYVY